jgi:uncharacterized small protein (DUF1192 family)
VPEETMKAMHAENERLRAEIERLRAEIEALRADRDADDSIFDRLVPSN